MLQSRPVTAPERGRAAGTGRPRRELVAGLGAAPGSASGEVRVIGSRGGAAELGDGEVLVTHMTAPDWVPLMRRAAAIVTDSGGMTCHAAIVSRELGIPCVVGTVDATAKLRDGELVTVDAGAGVVHRGRERAGGTPAPMTGPPRGGRSAGDRRRSSSSTSPSRLNSSGRGRSTSTGSACCAQS